VVNFFDGRWRDQTKTKTCHPEPSAGGRRISTDPRQEMIGPAAS
jgi:hypothetical protein